jgi:hypothetical protein
MRVVVKTKMLLDGPARQGHPIKAVAQRLGHSDVGITLGVCAHILPTDDAKLSGALQARYA